MVGFTVVKGASVVRVGGREEQGWVQAGAGWCGSVQLGVGRFSLVWVGAAWCGSVQLGMGRCSGAADFSWVEDGEVRRRHDFMHEWLVMWCV